MMFNKLIVPILLQKIKKKADRYTIHHTRIHLTGFPDFLSVDKHFQFLIIDDFSLDNTHFSFVNKHLSLPPELQAGWSNLVFPPSHFSSD
ncbi:hypothetical protein GDO81_026224 [Engystomops pustulosus]|uniref:Uncharacterized protein n=1 Tax=Engystomops pustulosus TaxID=76066 RepID=A0AAV6Z5Y0_ENGPU|nr:hypothetical protein GDO81_026224 [Engystomops pustulosus]